MNLQPLLKNELVLLRPLQEEDKEALYQVAKDPKIWEQHPFKRYRRAEFDTFFKESIASKAALTIIDNKTGQVIGTSRYKTFGNFPDYIEIGWTFLSRDYWGGKYNTTVKDLMLRHAFNHVTTVILFADKNNIRSQKAIKKLGGVLIDTPKQIELPKGPEGDFTFVVEKATYQ